MKTYAPGVLRPFMVSKNISLGRAVDILGRIERREKV